MEQILKNPALLVHIEHSKPVEVDDFITSLNALNDLYASFVKRTDKYQAISKPRLYVEKVEEGSIDVFLCELASAAVLPFMENVNIILDFAGHIKSIYKYFVKGEGAKPVTSYQECKNVSSLMNVVVKDQKSSISIGAVNKAESGDVYNNCTFNFGEGNGVKRVADEEAETMRPNSGKSDRYSRVLMKVYQMRNDTNNDVGNKAIVDSIFKGRKMGLVFATDELKNDILFSDFNPTQKLFWVDIEVLTIDGKPKAYNVTGLHDIVDEETT